MLYFSKITVQLFHKIIQLLKIKQEKPSKDVGVLPGG